MVHCIFVASLEATAGSVIANADRISPSSRGSRYFFFYYSFAYSIRVSLHTNIYIKLYIFPVSGAEQLNTSGAKKLIPINSHMNAYSRWVSPFPYTGNVQNRFHSPLALAFLLRSSSWGITVHRYSSLRVTVTSLMRSFSTGNRFSIRNLFTS